MLSGIVTGGPKVAKHEYPNSDTQTIETLGKTPRAYSVTIIIGGGSNYLVRRDALLRILEQEAVGKLVHPLYGDIENVIALPYTLTENFNALGEGQISVIFEVSEGTGIPESITGNTLNAIERAHNELLDQIDLDFVESYVVKTNQPTTYMDALSKGVRAGEAFSENVQTAQGSADKINNFNSTLATFQSKLTSLVTTPQAYVDDIQNLFRLIEGLYSDIIDTVKVIENFFVFGDDDTTLNLTTPSRITRDSNRCEFNAVMQATALSYSYFNSAQLSFQTVNDIDKRFDTLETQYQKLTASECPNDVTKDVLTDLRLNVQQFFETEKLTAQQIVTVNTKLTSARLLAYSYYGSSELGSQISELNESQEPTFIEGATQILTA